MKRVDPKIRLIITIALKKEAPTKWFLSNSVPVYTLEALKSGALSQLNDPAKGVMVVITGAGPDASFDAACWIRDNLDPLFVLNVGICGVVQSDVPLVEWIQPRVAVNEGGEEIELDSRLPIPCRDNSIVVESLMTVRDAKIGGLPDKWKKYNLVDMECFSQANVFKDTDIAFHCLKFGSDYEGDTALESFNENLEVFNEKIKGLLDFIEAESENLEITVVIPVYNRVQTIQRAVNSVLDQTYPASEIIVVDDGSTDGTKGILESYGEKITIIPFLENSGPSRARNAGVQQARTDWIAFLDSDDCWEKDKLKDQVQYLWEYPFYEIMQSEEIWIRNGVRVNPCRHHEKPVGWIFDRSLERCMISPSSVLVKKSLLQRYGNFDESLPVCEDYDLWLKISRHHPVGLDSSLSVIKYGGHEDQLSGKYPAMDSFRTRSLYWMLKNEHLPEFRDRIIPILKKKLKILIQGYEKRNKPKEARECRDMMELLGKQSSAITVDHYEGKI